LQVELETAVVEDFPEAFREGGVIGEADAVGVDEEIVDARIGLRPGQQFEEIGMERGFAAGELQDFDAALAVDDALDAVLSSASGTASIRAPLAPSGESA